MCLALVACAPSATPAQGPCELSFSDVGDVRVFVVTHRMVLDDAQTYRTFEDSYRRHLGAIAPCTSKRRPNLVVFGESSGLHAWFIGAKGLLARGSSDSSMAFNAVYAQHYRAADAYRGRFPGLSPARGLILAASDVAARAMDRTFGGLAKELGAWVITSADLPHLRRSEDPAERQLFADPETGEAAYVATGPEVYNSALLYDPDGKLVSRIAKAYLTDPEEQLLDLSTGPLDHFFAFELPFGRVGAAISRDAWYPPFNQRMDDLGVELVVQNEAFVGGYLLEHQPGDWLPDVMLSSGWLHNQKHRPFRHSVAPMHNGNLFEMVFDGQAWISSKGEPGQGLRGFIASTAVPGFLDVAPWTFEDPVKADPSLDLPARRAWLREKGKELAPGSGKPAEGRYLQGVLGADLFLYGDTRAPPPKAVPPGTSAPVAAAPTGHQANPAAAYDAAGTLYVTWSDTRSGVPRVYWARSSDGGRTFEPAKPLEPTGSARQLRPAVATGKAGVVLVAWQEQNGAAEQVRVAASSDGGASFSLSWVEATAAAQWEPALAVHGDEAALAWVDFRGGMAPKVRLACARSSAFTFGASREVDAATAALPRVQGSQFQPTLAFARDGRLAAAWLDYREKDWQVYAALSASGGCATSLGPAAPVTEDHPFEVLASDPQLSPGPGGELLLAWEELRERRAHRDVRAALLAAGSTDWKPTRKLVGGADDGAFFSRFRPSAAFVQGAFQLVFQDLRTQKSALFGARLSGDAWATPTRVDDTGTSAVQLTRPRLVARTDGTGALLLYEDDQGGWSRVRAAPAP